MKRLILAVAVVGLTAAPAVAGERADAKVTCKETSKERVYDCMIMLTGKKSKAPLQGATITVKADMPSMPMAHNVRPVKAKPMGKPGMYHAKLHLEMYGEWALRMTVTGPTRDIVIRKHQFGNVSANQGDTKHMKHGSGMKKMEHGKGEMKKMEGGKHKH